MEFPLSVPLCNGRNVIIFFRPRFLPGFIGMFLLITAVVTGLVSVFTGHKANWILLLVCLILALNGIQMIFLSLLGQYMSKDYMESKKRPIYIIKKKGVLTPPFLRQL